MLYGTYGLLSHCPDLLRLFWLSIDSKRKARARNVFVCGPDEAFDLRKFFLFSDVKTVNELFQVRQS
jgi:hypothetical protein